MFLKILILSMFLVTSTLASDSCGATERNDRFVLKKGIEVRAENKQETLIAQMRSSQYSDCLTNCMMECECFIAVFIGQLCQLFSIVAKDFLVENLNNDAVFYYKINMLDGVPISTMEGITTTVPTTTTTVPTTTVPVPTTATVGLQNHWAFNGSYIDRAGGMNMTIQLNGGLTTDRFGNLNNALLLNSGYGTVPEGVYFDPVTGGFSVMAWIKISAFAAWQAIIDFGNGVSDNAVLHFESTTGAGRLAIANNNDWSALPFNSQLVNIGEWTHMAVSVNGSVATYYLNGTAKGNLSGITYRKIQRSGCYIGRINPSFSVYNEFWKGVIDELKIFSRGLSQQEIAYEMNRL